jgi:cell division protein ZapA (FtsZ GTPase activity inhibitor)
MKKTQVRIQILGSSFTVQTDESPEYLHRVVQYLSDKVGSIERSTGTSDPLKAAILAGIIVVDELFRLRDNSGTGGITGHEAEEAERITRQLIRKIDETLKNP